MSSSDSRRAALLGRLAGLTEAQREALARALGEHIPSSGRGRLVAYVTSSGEPPSAREVGEFLEGRLPEYMIPARYVLVEDFPRNAAGKLDRRALRPELGFDLGRSMDEGPADPVAPRNETEARLVGIWREVLGTDEIGVHDDFFEIGGDSLLSIRVISRARRAGIPIRPDRFFEAPTIARIAAEAARDVPEAEQGPVVGEAPATPIQEWFFERITEGRDHWNQAVMLEAPPGVDLGILEAVMGALVAHHDALRVRFARTDDRWRQVFPEVPDRVPLRAVDVSGVRAGEREGVVRDESDDEHAAMELARGGLFRAVLFHDASGPGRILLVAHHLLVDGVSWRVLLEDISTLVGQALDGAELRLPAKTASLRAWAEALLEIAERPDVTAEADRWIAEAGPDSWARVPRDRPEDGRENRMGSAATHRFSLAVDDARDLLEGATRRLEATPQEILLAGLLLGWCRWSGRSGLRLDLEGHGRNVLGEDWDVSRTVGWFTTVFPLTLELPEIDAGAAVRSVRSAMRRLPLRGASHGLLRYLHPEAEVRQRLAGLPRSELLFNYLGSVDDRLPPDSHFELADTPAGGERSPEAPRAYLLEVNARLEEGRLVFDMEYSRGFHEPETVVRLAEAVRAALLEISERVPESASRFELAELDEEGLGKVADLLAEIDDG